MSQSSGRQANSSSYIDKRFIGLVAAQMAPTGELVKGAFDNLAFGQHLEADSVTRFLEDLRRPANVALIRLTNLPP